MKDPYLKPVILGGLVIALLSMIFAPGIFIWAIIGGYVAVRLSNKNIKELISYIDTLILGILTGITGGTLLDIFSAFSFYSVENKRLLITTLEKSWPKEMYPKPDFYEAFPSIFLITCIMIIIISILFAIIGAFAGLYISKKKAAKKIEN